MISLRWAPLSSWVLVRLALFAGWPFGVSLSTAPGQATNDWVLGLWLILSTVSSEAGEWVLQQTSLDRLGGSLRGPKGS
jgi:hypothetical protein